MQGRHRESSAPPERDLRRVGARAVRGREHRPGAPRDDEGGRARRGEGAVPGHRQGHRERPQEHLDARDDDRARRSQVPHEGRRSTRSRRSSSPSSTTRREAEQRRRASAHARGDDEIVIPRVYHSLSTKRVLTAELHRRRRTTRRSARTRRRKSATPRAPTIWRFMFRSLFEHGVLYADPHPGNYRFLGGGKVAFLDFGCVQGAAARTRSRA